MMGWPWARRSAATAEESTPPDMATAMVSCWGIAGTRYDDSLRGSLPETELSNRVEFVPGRRNAGISPLRIAKNAMLRSR